MLVASPEVVLLQVSGWVLLYDRRRYQARRMVVTLAHCPRVVFECGLEVEVEVLAQGPTRKLPVTCVEVELRVQVLVVLLVALELRVQE